MSQEVEQVRGLEAQQALDRLLQRIVRALRLRVVPPTVMVRIETQPATPRIEVALDVVLADEGQQCAHAHVVPVHDGEAEQQYTDQQPPDHFEGFVIKHFKSPCD